MSFEKLLLQPTSGLVVCEAIECMNIINSTEAFQKHQENVKFGKHHPSPVYSLDSYCRRAVYCLYREVLQEFEDNPVPALQQEETQRVASVKVMHPKLDESPGLSKFACNGNYIQLLCEAAEHLEELTGERVHCDELVWSYVHFGEGPNHSLRVRRDLISRKGIVIVVMRAGNIMEECEIAVSRGPILSTVSPTHLPVRVQELQGLAMRPNVTYKCDRGQTDEGDETMKLVFIF